VAFSGRYVVTLAWVSFHLIDRSQITKIIRGKVTPLRVFKDHGVIWLTLPVLPARWAALFVLHFHARLAMIAEPSRVGPHPIINADGPVDTPFRADTLIT
jgi:hypothetical protein